MGGPSLADIREFVTRVGSDHQPETRRRQERFAVPDSQDGDRPKTGEAEMWAISGDEYHPCTRAVRVLPPDYYVPVISPNGAVHVKSLPTNSDHLLLLLKILNVLLCSQILPP